MFFKKTKGHCKTEQNTCWIFPDEHPHKYTVNKAKVTNAGSTDRDPFLRQRLPPKTH